MSVTVQFHPNWPYQSGLVIESMARDGRYRSQFETGISNGGLSAYPTGERWRRESHLFGGMYDFRSPSVRPVYGAWNRNNDAYGGSPRFGSAYLRLRSHVLERTSFCFPDSIRDSCETGDASALGRLGALADSSEVDYLDDYVEAQIHSGLIFPDDIEAVVLDPCHQSGTVFESARRLECAIEFHPGFQLCTTSIDTSFRGREPVALARELGTFITPDTLGRAACDGQYSAQAVKRVWHLLARFGRR